MSRDARRPSCAHPSTDLHEHARLDQVSKKAATRAAFNFTRLVRATCKLNEFKESFDFKKMLSSFLFVGIFINMSRLHVYTCIQFICGYFFEKHRGRSMLGKSKDLYRSRKLQCHPIKKPAAVLSKRRVIIPIGNGLHSKALL